MPSIKIYPPTPLPDKDVTETRFSIWKEELEVYLSQEKGYAVFLADGKYSEWQSLETNPNRIQALHDDDRQLPYVPRDENDPNREITQNEANLINAEKLADIRKDLRTVLSIVGKCVSEGHYNSVVRHSTSLKDIYGMLRSDYDIQHKGIHFFNILDVKYDPSSTTPVAFYNQYRTVISNNLAKNGDVIKYKGNEALTQDEKMTPMLEDIILLDVIREIDGRLPAFVKTHYNHKMKRDERLMDFKSDILVNIPAFLEQLESTENNQIKETASLHAFRPQQVTRSNFNKKASKKTAQPTQFCRVCKYANLPREIVLSHNVGDQKCPSLSSQEKQRLKGPGVLSNIKDADEDIPELDEDEAAEMYGYPSVSNDNEVNSSANENVSNHSLSRTDIPACGYIKPIPSQILTVFENSKHENPIHIDLDSGATVNYCTEEEARRRGFKIYPNSQMSKLGDGVTKIKGVGEINVHFYRNKIKLKYSAIVCRELQSPFIGGTPFLKENGIEQDLVKNVIHLHQRQITVQPTDPYSLLPTAPVSSGTSEVKKNSPNTSPATFHFKRSVLLPEQEIAVPVDKKEGTEVYVEAGINNNVKWPEPQLKTVTDGKITLHNSKNEPILLGNDAKTYHIKETVFLDENLNEKYYKYRPTNSNISANADNVALGDIKIGKIENEKVRMTLDKAHEKFKDVFNNDLSVGYNNFYGKHECKLNWATSERPSATKVRVPNYEHGLKVLQQEKMDDLTDQGVLLIPQDHGITVQSVCPSFVQRKQRAKDKPKDKLTKDDLRLLINFGPINDLIKPVPIHVPKSEDVMIMLGRWNHIIQFDLKDGYFQNHMSKDSIPWLGVQTPFGGLRVISRSGQGLAGMHEELDELTAKVLKDEMKQGICVKIADDVYVGGDSQEEAVANYIRILEKLHNANLKISPSKTLIFPKETDILGWVWKEGGQLQASPHRKLALANTKVENIVKVHDMRSWIGLFKTLHIVTPHISHVLAPFEEAVAGRDSKDLFVWNFELEKKFREAKECLDTLVPVYLPAPHDQLILETDAAQGGGKYNYPAGIGHVLYAVKDGKKVPVRYHSAKLPDKCRKWSPCEIEALALAAGINREYDIIRESKHALIIQPDSKPVHEAIKLINKGKFSSSARISSFLTNINRTKIDSRHISGKAKLNPVSDLQSRYPPDCTSELCSVHKFINETIDSVIEVGANLSSISEVTSGFTNRASWKVAQEANQACTVAKQLLSSGKPPPKAIGKTSGDYWNDIRQYCRDASISKDGLLVVKSQPNVISGNIPRDRIVVPKPLVAALLYHTHNHSDQHPAKTQQKSLFQRQFYAIGLDKHLELLYENCYKCSVLQKLPKEIIPNETKTFVEGPQTHFHADVIKRATQNILTVKDHFSSFQDAILLNSETAKDLKEGLIMMTSAMRRPAEIFISVDNSPGFKTLLTNTDQELKKLMITIVRTDEINKNSNAVIDKGCQELENEIKQLEPEGGKVSISTLKKAVLNLNSKLRRRGNISAFEINTARDQNTGDNLKLNDKALRQDQIDKRKESREIEKKEDINVGDTVRVKNKSDKHKANEIFVVTSKKDDNVGVQKILHPLQSKPKLMSKVYNTNQKHLITIHHSKVPDVEEESDVESINISKNISTKTSNSWNPVSSKFFNNDSDDDTSEEDDEDTFKISKEENLEAEIIVAEGQLEWDDSPEQYLHHGNDENNDDEALRPRRLFDDESDDHASTEETTDDEVFERVDFHTPLTTPKLKRRNAMRRGRRQNISNSEPRVTRNMLQSDNYRISISNPTSPSKVVLSERQNLENILVPNHPLIPEQVDLEPIVQNFDQVLETIEVEERRRSTRASVRLDYKKLDDGQGRFRKET